MVFSLVEGAPKDERVDALRETLATDAVVAPRPFDPTISTSLRNARRESDARVVGEQEDDCSPPLTQERDAVLNRYF